MLPEHPKHPDTLVMCVPCGHRWFLGVDLGGNVKLSSEVMVSS